MNKLLLLYFSLLFSFVVSAQNVTDNQGRKQGKWVKYHKDGKTIRYKGEFIDDKPVGEFVHYYETGEVSTVIIHVKDEVSECKSYHINGSIMAKGNYHNKLKEGTWWFFGDDKTVMAKENYSNGVLNGLSVKYYPSKFDEPLKILEQTNYIDGLAQGEWKKYFKDGKVQVEGKFKDGLKFGKSVWYKANGVAEVVGYFKDGEKTGWWTFTDEDGEETKAFYLLGNVIEGEVLEKYLDAQKKKQLENEN